MSKASNLGKMKREGINVPNFINITKLDITEEDFNIGINVFNQYLTFSVRSSGSVSTPGRMDTILNVKHSELFSAFQKVKRSLTSESVKTYLRAKEITDFTASIIIQEMVVVSNNGSDCAGVLTTIHPVTEKEIYYGNVIFGKQGDMVMNGTDYIGDIHSLQERNLTGYYNLMAEVRKVENLFETPQEIEFTIKNDVAYILQSRDFNKFSGQIQEIEYDQKKYIGSGEPSTPLNLKGICTYEKSNSKGKILITQDTDFEDTELLINCIGIITTKGGILSHASMIAREFNIPCIVGAVFKIKPEEGKEIIMHNTGAITN